MGEKEEKKAKKKKEIKEVGEGEVKERRKSEREKWK